MHRQTIHELSRILTNICFVLIRVHSWINLYLKESHYVAGRSNTHYAHRLHP